MRPIGQLETEEQARTFADYLFLRDVEAQIEPAKGGAWGIWVVDEERVDESKALLSRFRSMPDAEEFYQASAAAAERRRGAEKEIRKEEKLLKRSAAFPRLMRGGGLTMVLLILCVVVAMATKLGQDPAWTGWLLISMEKVSGGQVWRLFTPAFLHFSLWHLLFNLLWLQDLGTVLEIKIGTGRFAAVVALVALVSNLAQYAAGGAGFGGMSGVVYGVFGYLWIRGKRDFRFGLTIAPMTSGLLLVFLALGIFGLLGPTANAAHFSGLLVGGALGWLAGSRKGA
ncbi:MAG: Rhomboid protease GlpG [Verrucomicrobia bacterium ADurb.Bin018]|jgi:GlpG protein|nr:MAG: Rhomboid protease GlpG [Verrucomicrobia bacterium ADurb.Bin018]